jgi:hypothetical protein
MRTTVVMIDRVDRTIHLPATGRGNLVTECGLVLGSCTIGPRAALEPEGVRYCLECWEEPETVRVIAEALCPGDGDHFQTAWPCDRCWRAAQQGTAALPVDRSAP